MGASRGGWLVIYGNLTNFGLWSLEKDNPFWEKEERWEPGKEGGPFVLGTEEGDPRHPPGTIGAKKECSIGSRCQRWVEDEREKVLHTMEEKGALLRVRGFRKGGEHVPAGPYAA